MSDSAKDYTQLPWYEPELGEKHLSKDIRAFYEAYTGLKGDELNQHLLAIRERAFARDKYPCVGSWIFLHDHLAEQAIYPALLERVRSAGATVLDLGCGFGQDLRKVAWDSGKGVISAADADTSSQFVATDLNEELWALGFDLFRDKGRMGATMVPSDLLQADAELYRLGKRFDYIIAAQILHLFSWDQNMALLKPLVRTLTRPGTVFLGFQFGRYEDPKEVPSQWGTMFFHNVESFQRMWAQVGEETGTTWQVDATLADLNTLSLPEAWLGPVSGGFCLVRFTVTRLPDEAKGVSA